MSKSRFVIRPKAGRDLDTQACFYATEGTRELGHRFLEAAHETFVLLASHPEMGWNPKLRHPKVQNLRVFRVSGFERILILYRPIEAGIEVLRIVHGSRNVQAVIHREGID